MPYVSGSYTPSNGFYDGEGLFRQARLANDDIRSDHMDGLVSDLSDALNDCLLRDGSAPLAGSLDMGNNRITNVAAATLSTDIVPYGQAVENGVRRATRETISTSGSTHTITLELSPLPTTLTNLFVRASMPSTQTGSFDIAISGLDTRTLHTTSGASANLTVAEGEPLLLLYDRSSSRWIWLNSPYELAAETDEPTFVDSPISNTQTLTWDLDTNPNILVTDRPDGSNLTALTLTVIGGESGQMGRAIFNVENYSAVQVNISYQNDTEFAGVAGSSRTLRINDFAAYSVTVVDQATTKYVLGFR